MDDFELEFVDLGEDDDSVNIKKKRSIWKKILIVLGVIAGAAVVIYLGITIFFMNFFFVNTTINGQDFSLKSVGAVQDYMQVEIDKYTLEIKGKDGSSQSLTGSDIGLKLGEGTKIKEVLKGQKALLWPLSFNQKTDVEIGIDAAYDKQTLSNTAEELVQKYNSSVGEDAEPVSSKPKFKDDKFVPSEEEYGKRLESEAVQEAIQTAAGDYDQTIDLEAAKCYEKPQYTSESQEVIDACAELNEYLAVDIVYEMTGKDVTISKKDLSKWLKCDKELKVSVNKKKIEAYMKEFGKKYDTVGKSRTITTPTGKSVQVSGGTYGWVVNEAEEVKKLAASLEKKENIKREPTYKQTAASHDEADWGNTYAEVDLTQQRMWYISDGNVVFEAPVVTGLPTEARRTPTGVYDCLELKQGKVLKGDVQADGTREYETPVEYWMRVTWTGIGFHTATWQPTFGGERYKTNGSHGCINMSKPDSVTLYGLIKLGDPVIIHD